MHDLFIVKVIKDALEVKGYSEENPWSIISVGERFGFVSAPSRAGKSLNFELASCTFDHLFGEDCNLMKDQVLNLNSHGKASYIGDDCSEETLEDILDLKEKLVYSLPHGNPWNPLVLLHLCLTVPRSNCWSKGDHLTLLLLWFFLLPGTKCIIIWSTCLPFYWVKYSFLLCSDLTRRFEAFPHLFRTRVSWLLAQFRQQHRIFLKSRHWISLSKYNDSRLKQALFFSARLRSLTYTWNLCLWQLQHKVNKFALYTSKINTSSIVFVGVESLNLMTSKCKLKPQMRLTPLPIFEAKHIWQPFKWGKSTSCHFVACLAAFLPKKLTPLAQKLSRSTCRKYIITSAHYHITNSTRK